MIRNQVQKCFIVKKYIEVFETEVCRKKGVQVARSSWGRVGAQILQN